MKKMLYLPLMLAFTLLLSLSVFAASVSRDMPSRVSPGQSITVTFTVSGAEAGKLFTLEEDLPEGWTFTDWDVSGAKEDKAVMNIRNIAAENRHGWSFTPTQSDVKIKYVVTASSTLGSYDFKAVWFDSSGYNKDSKSAVVRVIKCGDGVCEGSEATANCPADCPAAPEPKPQPQPEPVVTPPEGGQQGNIPVTGIIIAAAVILIGLVAFLIIRKRK
ncbi:hypothetical protein HYY72_02565 [Candidatus Woesearchaeota archaeon]|nr:hypothetical protein [Candidatus Woesearchaeota archaeon]